MIVLHPFFLVDKVFSFIYFPSKIYAKFPDQKLTLNILFMFRGVVVILHGLNEHRFVCYNKESWII